MKNLLSKLSTLLFIALLSLVSCGKNDPVRIIFDTDLGGDADDLGALAMLHHLQNAGECELEAIMCWSTERYSVPAIDAVNRFYGNPDIPVGVRKEGSHSQEWTYGKPVADEFHYELEQEEAMDATLLYRKTLANAADGDLVLVTVGPLKNILNLLHSGPDHISPLNGQELLHKKVRKVVIMGGRFPAGDDEWNFNGGMPGVTMDVLEMLKLPVVFSGFELGVAIKTGEIFNSKAVGTPLYTGFLHFSEHAPWMKKNFQGKILDNASYDQTAVLYAVRGCGELFAYSESGSCLADSTGGNRWEASEAGLHYYLKMKSGPATIAEEIESLMLGK